ncbi:MAG: tetratricopeptide repeat protein [Paracoccaceae bacterium]|nr:tetratricopeptide repeat protein [Paracoccaceae bacterium]
MGARTFVAVIAASLLAACSSGGLQQVEGSPFAPVGRVDSSQSVDGLIVGHRLMAAGEYELALRAYSRAAAEDGMSVDVLSALGSANLRLGRLGQAEKLLRRATQEDAEFVPAWNNLGVVLMETEEFGEAARVFRVAFALDSGESDDIRDNLRLALAKIENPAYSEPDNQFALVRRGTGSYLLLETP